MNFWWTILWWALLSWGVLFFVYWLKCKIKGEDL